MSSIYTESSAVIYLNERLAPQRNPRCVSVDAATYVLLHCRNSGSSYFVPAQLQLITLWLTHHGRQVDR